MFPLSDDSIFSGNKLGLFLEFNTKPGISIKKREQVNKADYRF